ncbi:MAG: hypothetical protein K5984_05020 [Bacteroidales bacterium]|nr:hypothetical protein [Bacteroidales bacterium]
MDNKDLHKTTGQTVPEGYFENLQMRLSEIPEKEKTKVVPLRTKLVPYVSLAAGFAILLAVGNFVLRSTATSTTATSEDEEQLYYASLLSTTVGYEDLYYDEETADEDDIINYLIESGTSLNQIASVRFSE